MAGGKSNYRTSFEICVAKQNFKFNAAHFVAFSGYRERLHGHNYQVSIRLHGSRKVSHDGYLLDYGFVKDSARKVCKRLNEHFLCPVLSDVLTITADEANVKIGCEDGTSFSFPADDVVMLPIAHATTEELAVYISGKLLEDLDASMLIGRGIHTMEVTVAEAPGQEALFRIRIEDTLDSTNGVFDIHKYLMDNAPDKSLITGCKTMTSSNDNKEINDDTAESTNRHNSTIGNTKTDPNNNKQHTKNGACCTSCTEQFAKKLAELENTIKNIQENMSAEKSANSS